MKVQLFPQLGNPNIIIVLVAGALVCLTVGVSYFIYDSTKSRIFNEHLSRVEHETVRLVAEVGNRLSTLSLASKAVAKHIKQAARGGDSNAALGTLHPYLVDIGRDLPALRTIVVIDPTGIITDDLRPKQPGVGIDVSDRKYFSIHMNRDVRDDFVAEPVISRVDGKWTWPFSVPVRNDAGSLLAVVLASVDSRFFGKVLERPVASQNLDTLIIHRNVTVLQASSRMVSKMGLRITNTSLIDDTMARGPVLSESARGPFGRPNLISSVARVRDWPLFIVNLLEHDVVTQQLAVPMRRTILFSAVVCLLILSTALIQVRHNLQRARAESALRRSEKRFRELLESAPDAMVIVNQQGEIVLVNKQTEAIFGCGRETLVGSPVETLIAHDLREGHVDKRTAFSAEPKRRPMGQSTELFGVARDGRKFPVEISLGPIETEEGMLISATVRDITETKVVEERLHQAEKVEAVGQLTAGVAHDFNNMLAVTWGNAELLEDEIGKDNPQLAAVFRATKRGADLTQRLLAFSRKQVLSPEIINANNLIADTTDLLRHTLEEHIDIETVTGAGLWNCEVDPAQLENALVNLAVNARDAMPDGGKLTIETANARLDDDYAAAQAEVTPGQYVMLAVTDTGSGMPLEVRKHVFEPFYTTKEVGKGTGLGLSMVYGFVKQSGGHVTIYSEPGEGTTIKLYLPRSTATETVERKPATDEVPASRGETVLVVEDDPDLLTLAVSLLSSLGYQIMEAATGVAALEQLGSTTRVSLLLTDVMLPGGMNGRELAAEAEQRAPGIRVLYMSGYTENAIVHHGRLDAGAELLQKPFRRADLARAVRKVLDSPST